ncbi:MKRN2 opposite strand protein [Schistocerca nitens]|uniref:MKRN2 opposite strand protein n=1 Tax=Schistocerca nitens TaxID=7011 RepID=UPI0021198231|nr:MKRN2 opposite strand protein [Schistocerca nitens]XP_049812018.1 MKRN2 opposite strand protein [Schistocerca nitens]XP_049812019.1 MKRN2 opposite strand protein [Schistocerca nitens]XP_049812020.1 MKRN2 opposite strand protein [Schistocerca nitens]XP_049812021.1 MKRN2 opposite strand protein [Schistocerca nitens]
MDTDPGVICFQHCDSKVFCFKLPEKCPVCQSPMANTVLPLPPFRIPYPFVRASQHSCCIVMKPTNGDFLNDYLNSKDLHIGVTSSKGLVVEYDKNGLQYDKASLWKQCLIVDGADESWSEIWDNTLRHVSSLTCWSSERYNEENFNCYNFVLKFLQELRYGALSAAAVSRTRFCESYIVPQTTTAGKYISLYRKLKKSGCVIHRISSKHTACNTLK